jgi:hypothetical protein
VIVSGRIQGSRATPAGPRSIGPVLPGVSRAIDPIQNKKRLFFYVSRSITCAICDLDHRRVDRCRDVRQAEANSRSDLGVPGCGPSYRFSSGSFARSAKCFLPTIPRPSAARAGGMMAKAAPRVACRSLSLRHMQGKVMRVKRLKNGKSTTHPLYNGEVKAVKD